MTFVGLTLTCDLQAARLVTPDKKVVVHDGHVLIWPASVVAAGQPAPMTASCLMSRTWPTR